MQRILQISYIVYIKEKKSDMKFVPYSDYYKDGVLACLKRNIQWMSTLSDNRLYEWLLPIINYPWIEQIDSKKCPYKHGVILLDDIGKVRGFSAAIHSIQAINGQERVFINPSTTVVDKKFRFYFIGMCEEMFKYGDAIIDVSPNESVQKVSKKIFNFSIVDNPMYMMKSRLFGCKRMNSDEKLSDSSVIKAMKDHGNCGIKCVRLYDDIEYTYVFYKIIKKIKKMPIRTLCVLHVSNLSFFTENFIACVSRLSHKEHCLFTMADSRYVDINNLPKLFIKKQKFRAISNHDLINDYTFLYTELALLQNEMV